MKPNTSAAAHIGRIGALAVALGVGAAVTFGHGVASADTTGSGSSSSASSSESSSDSGQSGSSRTSGGTTAADSSAADAPKDEDTAAEADEDEADDQADEDDAVDQADEDDAVDQVAEDDADDQADEDDAVDQVAEDEVVEDEPADEPVDTGVDVPASDEEPVDDVSADESEPSVDEPVTQIPAPPAAGSTGSDEQTDDEPTEEVAEEQPATEDVESADDAAGEDPATANPVIDDDIVAGATPADDATPASVFTRSARSSTVATTFASAAAPSIRSLPAPPDVPAMISGFLAAVGLGPLAAALPTAPAAPPTLWAMLALARREFERAFTRPNLSVAPAGVVAPAAATPFPTTLPSVNKGWVTGKVPNNFGIGGTDLGIMWDGGVRLGERFVHVAFGDTFANANMTGDWRSNVLLIATDNHLGNGLQLVQTGYAGRFLGPFAGRLGLFGSEVTQIPTSGIQIDGRQFVNFMSVKSWDTPGRWTTNYSAISVYDPATDKWVLAPSTIRSAGWFRSTTRYVPGSQNFQQAAYVLQPEDQVGEDGIRYLYAFGTPSGRAGSAYLSRVAEGSVTDLSKYEYWDGSKWVANRPAVAAPIIGDSKRSAGLFGFVVDWANDPNVLGGYLGGLFGAKTGGNVSEMSVQYNEYLDKYVVLYGDGNNDIQLRTADTPEGPWSAPITIATSKQYPGLYAPMIHPWSGTGDLRDSDNNPDLNNLYWNMSLWGDYNVVLMQTDLSPLKTINV
ncbi:DUF4185 domain-containing protein [Mycolicibacterium litorale]|nr:DUF4185 domain-containing protein [Mycolicibacterium litorale]